MADVSRSKFVDREDSNWVARTTMFGGVFGGAVFHAVGGWLWVGIALVVMFVVLAAEFWKLTNPSGPRPELPEL